MSALPANSIQLGDGAGGFIASASATMPIPGWLILGDGATQEGQLYIKAADGTYIVIHCSGGTTPWNLFLPQDSGVAGAVLQADGGGATSWVVDPAYNAGDPSTWAGSPPTTIGTAIDRLAACLAAAFAAAGLVQSEP